MFTLVASLSYKRIIVRYLEFYIQPQIYIQVCKQCAFSNDICAYILCDVYSSFSIWWRRIGSNRVEWNIGYNAYDGNKFHFRIFLG